MRIEQCRFLHNIARGGLVKVESISPRISDCYFKNTTGVIFQKLNGAWRVERISVEDTVCTKSNSACLLEGTSNTRASDLFGLFLNEITVVNMTLPPESSVITINSVGGFDFLNSVFSNISGSARDSCLSIWSSGDSMQQSRISNFTANNFSSGCIYMENTINFEITDFAFNNDGFNIISQDGKDGRDVITEKRTVLLTGNNSLSKTKGGAIHLRNCSAISLRDGKLQNNGAEFGGALFMHNTTGTIKNVSFLNNTAMWGGGLYAEKSSLDLSNVTFAGNLVDLTGGGAHFEEMSGFTLNNVTFRNNQGLKRNSSLITNNSRGGAIYYSCKQENNPCRPSILGPMVVSNNSADIGGAIYFNNHIFYPTKSSNFDKNSARRYGPIFASSPIQILYGNEMESAANPTIRIFFENGTQISRGQLIQRFFVDPSNLADTQRWEDFANTTKDLQLPLKVNISYVNQRGGSRLLSDLSFYAIDNFGQQIGVDNEMYHVKIEPTQSNSSASKNTYTVNSTNGSFLFGNNSNFTAFPGDSLALNIQSNIKCLLLKSRNIVVNITFKQCDIGEIIPSDSEICSLCPVNSYSLTPALNSSVICQPCRNVPGLMCKTGGRNLTVNPEYWRYDESSLNVIRCLNPTACSPEIPDTRDCSDTYLELKPGNITATCKKISHISDIRRDYESCSSYTLTLIEEYCAKFLDGTATGVCNRGYEGALCSDCRYGWGKSKLYQCVECKLTFSFFVRMIGGALIKAGMIVYTIYNAQKAVQDKRHSTMLRILITFFQIEGLLFAVPMVWPPFFDGVRSFILSLFTSDTNPGGYSYDCISYWTGSTPLLSYFESNALYSLFAPIIWTVAAALFLLLRKYLRRGTMTLQESKDILIITCLVTYFYFWPAIITAAFNTLHCIDIGANDLRLLSDPSLSCAVGRHWILLFFGVATLFFAGFLFPALFFLKLRRNQNSLEDARFLKTYGFVYRGYDKNYYYWEFLVLLRKMALVGTSVFLARYLTHMCITLSVIIVLSIVLQQKFSPFKDKDLNRLELVALFCLAAITFGCQYHINLADYISTMSFAILAGAATIIFLLQWSRIYVGIVRQKLEPICRGLKSIFGKCCLFLRSQPKDPQADVTEVLTAEIDPEFSLGIYKV